MTSENLRGAAGDVLVERFTPAYRSICIAVFIQGLANFAMLYSVQPLLPLLARTFGLTPAQSSLAVSSTTAAVALALLLSGFVNDAFGRKRMMLASLGGSTCFTLLAAAAPDWNTLLLCRALTGIALAGLPAATMTYLAEELAPRALGLGLGTYIAGSVVGGMSGRLMAGLLGEWFHWRWALVATGIIGIIGALFSAWRLPPSRHQPQRRPVAELAGRYRLALLDPALRSLFGAGFLLMGSFVAMYNYLGFHLQDEPYRITQGATAWVFVLYLLGVISAPLMGNLASRLGHARIYWLPVTMMLCGVLLTLVAPLWLVILGVGIMTFGYFGAHSVASGWVAGRARDCRAQASALYLSSFYAGASVVGSLGGVVLRWQGWPGLVVMLAAVLVMALAGGIYLRHLTGSDGR